MDEFDVIVIGAGPSGEVAAGRLAKAGLDVAVVEKHLVAGECSYYACMPSKALLRPGELFREARRVPGVAEALSGEIDAEAALARRDEVIHDLDDSSQVTWLGDHGIELFRGEGGLDGERRVRVGDRVLTARQAVILSTGTGAATPPIPGLDAIETWNNRQATTADERPRSMIVLGGGPVGCELAQAWSAFGTEVTLVEPESRLLLKEEAFAGELVSRSLQDGYGIEVIVGQGAESVAAHPDGVEVEIGDGRRLRAERLLLATGRRPMLAGLNLESVGIEPDGFLETADNLTVGGTDWLYAIGDVNGRALLTHMGKYQAWIATECILGNRIEDQAEGIGVPRVTFTDPQVAAVGITEESARRGGIEVSTVDVDTNSTAGASFTGKGVEGSCRLVVDRDGELIIGATFVGFEVAEWLQAATIAIVGRVPMPRLRHAVPAFPTRSEIWLRLSEAYESARR